MSDFRPTKRKTSNTYDHNDHDVIEDNDANRNKLKGLPSTTAKKPNDEPITITDSLLSSKLNKMSLEERSNGLYDLHCISDRIKETPELIRAKIAEMTEALESIITNQQDQHNGNDDVVQNNNEAKNATYSLGFCKALEKSPKYIESQKLRFLRAENFQSAAAADRMVRFFQNKLEYFGEEVLARDITFDDLNEDEAEALEAGALQILPERDQAGRTLFLMDGKLNLAYSTRSMIRVYMYFLTAVHQDEDIQKSGTVAIYYGLGQNRIVQGRAEENWAAYWSIPLYHVAAHYCQDSMNLVPNHVALIKLMEDRPLSRIRFHFGSHFEIIFILMTFGIPKDALPYRGDGSMDLTHHRQVLETLKYREKYGLLSSSPSTASDPFLREDKSPSLRIFLDSPSRSVSPIPCLSDEEEEDIFNDDHLLSLSSSSSLSKPANATKSTDSSSNNNNKLMIDNSDNKNIILVPGQMDLLLGRGRQQQTRPAMIRLNYLLEEHWDQFEAASKFEKTVIVEIILKLMKESNCRFLNAVQGAGYYEESDDVAARSKIAHSFRTLRKKKKVINKSSTTPY